jgi:hypothetical protein
LEAEVLERKPTGVLQVMIQGKLKGVLLLLFAPLLVGVAVLFFSIQPVLVLRCAHLPGHRETCSVEYRIAGVYPLDVQTFSDIRSVATEVETAQEGSGTRLVIQFVSGRVETAEVASPIGFSCETMRAKLAAFRASPADDQLLLWQAEAATSVLGAALLILSVFVLRSGVSRLLRPDRVDVDRMGT